MIRTLILTGFVLIFIFSACSKRQKQLSKGDFGDEWPFSVDNGSVECLDGYMVVFNTGGYTYALNDAARVTGKYLNLKEIIRPDANYPGNKIMMDLSRIEFEGLKLCDHESRNLDN